MTEQTTKLSQRLIDRLVDLYTINYSNLSPAELDEEQHLLDAMCKEKISSTTRILRTEAPTFVKIEFSFTH